MNTCAQSMWLIDLQSFESNSHIYKALKQFINRIFRLPKKWKIKPKLNKNRKENIWNQFHTANFLQFVFQLKKPLTKTIEMSCLIIIYFLEYTLRSYFQIFKFFLQNRDRGNVYGFCPEFPSPTSPWGASPWSSSKKITWKP